MSKELEALNRIGNIEIKYCEYGTWYSFSIKNTDDFSIVEAALKEVSGEDRALLKHIKKGRLHPLTTKCYHRLLEKEKTLQIIKEKKVNVSLLFNTTSVYDYNDYIARCRTTLNLLCETLTQENYDFLKKELK